MSRRPWNPTRFPFWTVGNGGAPCTQHATWQAAWQAIRRGHNEPYLTIVFKHPTLTQQEYEAQHPELRHR